VSVAARAVTLLVAFVAVAVGAAFVVIHYIVGTGANTLTTVDYTSAAHNGQVNVVLQEDPQNTVSSKPDWVSYFVMKPGGNPADASSWVHTTLFKVPANTRVNVTIYGYDGCTPLRNNYWSQVQGTQGGTVNVQQFLKGKALDTARNVSLINSWAVCSVAHTFAIPSLGVFVPVLSPTIQVFNKYACGTSPCVPSEGAYSIEKFSFMSPKTPGQIRWQCFIPCGGGFIDGNGGPMQTLGYMTGFMQVAA
jgi:hypothetical protein